MFEPFPGFLETLLAVHKLSRLSRNIWKLLSAISSVSRKNFLYGQFFSVGIANPQTRFLGLCLKPSTAICRARFLVGCKLLRKKVRILILLFQSTVKLVPGAYGPLALPLAVGAPKNGQGATKIIAILYSKLFFLQREDSGSNQQWNRLCIVTSPDSAD